MNRLLAVATALAIAVAVTGCGSAAEKVSENLAEKALEQSGGGNVDIQQSGDETVIKVETEEGTMVLGGGDLPEGMTVPVRDGGEVTASFSAPDGKTVSLAYPKGDYDDIVKFYEDWAASGDFEKSSFNTESDGTTFRSTSWYSDDGDISVSVTDNCADASGNEDAVCVMIIEGS